VSGRRLALAALALALAGCGASAQPQPGPPAVGRASYDVVAPLSYRDTVSQKFSPPDTLRFSLTLDPEAGLAVVGGGGSSQLVHVATSDGRTFHTTEPARVSVVSGQPCGQGITAFDFDTLTLAVGAALTGMAQGSAEAVVGDVVMNLSVTAMLTGTPDVTAPFPIAPGSPIDDPFAPFEVFASEPLAATATARLVGSGGESIDLVPQLATGAIPLVTGFAKPDVVLPLAAGFAVSAEGLVDLAGNRGATDTSLRIAAFPAAPLIPEDGFESATGTVGGATVVSTAITGTASAYVGASAPPINGTQAGAKLFVRLPRRASDTKVRFSYRVVAGAFPAAFFGSVYAGSVGGPVATTPPFPANGENPTALPGNAGVFGGDVHMMEVPLSDAVDGELVFLLRPGTVTCGFGPTGIGVLVDDLAVE
jgi:hypothetical protein